MIITEEKSAPIVTSRKLQAVEFGIADEMIGDVLKILRQGIYSNPIKAVCREILANGIDSSVQAGKTSKDVEVILPNQLSPVFKIRDKGVGLDEDEINEIYRFYGSSTKTNSNKQIGCLGLGSKSPFAYTSDFTIHTIKDGIERIFAASVSRESDSNDNGRGKIFKISERKTKELNGVCIEVPVKSQDFNQFRNETAYYLKFFKSHERPICKSFKDEELEVKYEIEGKKKDWFIPVGMNYDRESLIIQGNIPYDFNANDLPENYIEIGDDKDKKISFTSGEKEIIRLGLCFHVEMGTVDFQTSREKVRYTQLTLKTIKDRLQEIIAEIKEIFAQEISGLKNVYAAKRLYNKWFGHDSILRDIARLFDIKITFNGKEISSSYFELPDYKKIENLATKKKEYPDGEYMFAETVMKLSSGKVKKSKLNYISAIRDVPDCIVIQTEDKNCHGGRLKTAADELSTFTFIDVSDIEVWEKWLKEEGLDGIITWKYIDTFAKQKKDTTAKVIPQYSIYKYRKDAYKGYRDKNNVKWLESAYNSGDTIHFVPIDRFNMMPRGEKYEKYQNKDISFDDFNKIITYLKLDSDKIYGITLNRAKRSEKKSNFINVFKLFKDEVEKEHTEIAQLKADAEEYNSALASMSIYKFDSIFPLYEKINGDDNLTEFVLAAKELKESVEKLAKTQYNQTVETIYKRFYTGLKEAKCKINLQRLYDKFAARYPLLKDLSQYGIFKDMDEDKHKRIVEYIKLALGIE